MERQLEETKRKLTEAEQNMKKQKNVIDQEVAKRISKPPKLISVGAEFPDADYQLDSSYSDLDASTSTVDSDEMGIGFGLTEREEAPKPHLTWLQKAKQYYGISTSQNQAPAQLSGGALRMSEEKAFERRVIDGAEERNEFYRNNSNIIKGKHASTAHFDDEENEENEGGYNAVVAAAPNPGVSGWLNRVKRLTGEAHEPPHFSFTEENMLPQHQRTPPRKPKPQQSMSPQHAYLERVAGILKEPGLSPKKRNPVSFSQQTIDFGSDEDEDEDGSIRSLRTEEAFSPSTSFAATENSRMSRSFRFSKTVMSSETIDTSMDTRDTRLSVDTSVSLESGQWLPKSKQSKGKQKYYAQRLDESFESGKRFGGESSGSIAKLSRAGRADDSRWDRLFEEADSGDSDSGDSDY